MSDFGTATYENRSFAARRVKNCKSRLQNNQFWNRLKAFPKADRVLGRAPELPPGRGPEITSPSLRGGRQEELWHGR
jgi:hypothetical protein